MLKTAGRIKRSVNWLSSVGMSLRRQFELSNDHVLIENDIFWYLHVRKVGHLVTRWVTSVFSISVHLAGTASNSVILSRVSIYLRMFVCRFLPLPMGAAARQPAATWHRLVYGQPVGYIIYFPAHCEDVANMCPVTVCPPAMKWYHCH